MCHQAEIAFSRAVIVTPSSVQQAGGQHDHDVRQVDPVGVLPIAGNRGSAATS